MSTSLPIEVIANDANRCGEGPIWDGENHRLLWTDIPADTIFEFNSAAKSHRAIKPGFTVSAIALATGGRLIFGGPAGLAGWSESGGIQPIAADFEGQPIPINDMIASPSGGIYFGTIHWGSTGMEKTGRLYFINSAGRIRIVDENIELANGLGFSPDGKSLYFVDSAPRRIHAYDVNPASGELSRKRLFAQFGREDGLPDGLTVDADGHVWCALWYGSSVVQLSPDGKIQRRISLPAIQTSSLAFGGENLYELFVTTAAEPWPSDLAPAGYRADAPQQGGALYRVRPGVRGKPEYRVSLWNSARPKL